ncbi:MAG: hypothetical protein HPY53_00715 [Brevinematales bacterium]|nr:hypothetical protein [Brevinematales bacterium]
MKIFIRALLFAAAISASPLYADYVSDNVNKAFDLYVKDKSAALTIMTNLYKGASGQIITIRAMFAQRGYYAFYMEFLRLLPKKKPVVGEIISEDFLTSYYDFLADDIREYLKYYDKDVLITSYYRSIADNKATAALAGEIGDPVFFEILKRSLTLSYAPEKFDAILLAHQSAKILPAEVKKFILESWKFRPRDVGKLITAYGLQDDKDLQGFLVYSLFRNGDYAGIIEHYTAQPGAFPKDQMMNYQIDVPYFAAYSYFRTAQYAKAIELIVKVYQPWNYDLYRFITLCYLGMGDYKQVKMSMPKMKNGDTFQFIKGFVGFLEGKTNQAIQDIEMYLVDTKAAHAHTLEAMLLAFTYYNNPAELAAVAGIIRDTLLEKPVTGSPGVALSQAYTAGQDIPEKIPQSKLIGDFILYKKSVLLMKDGKNAEASDILMKLIKSPDTSALIRTLAVFQLRKVS